MINPTHFVGLLLNQEKIKIAQFLDAGKSAFVFKGKQKITDNSERDVAIKIFLTEIDRTTEEASQTSKKKISVRKRYFDTDIGTLLRVSSHPYVIDVYDGGSCFLKYM